MNKRNLRLDDYGISSKRFKELSGFCEQYPEWKKKIENYSYIKGVNYSDVSVATSNINDTTSEMAIKISNLLSKCNMIDESAKMADISICNYIIRNVCYEDSVNKLIADGMPCSANAFYDARRYFYYLLDKKKND